MKVLDALKNLPDSPENKLADRAVILSDLICPQTSNIKPYDQTHLTPAILFFFFLRARSPNRFTLFLFYTEGRGGERRMC